MSTPQLKTNSTAEIVSSVLLSAIELYRNHYGLAADWTPSAEDIATERARNMKWDAREYERDAAARLGVEGVPSPIL